jgi:hypothetical protein
MAGCGNGKYLGVADNVYTIGNDQSVQLLKIAKDRGHQVVRGEGEGRKRGGGRGEGEGRGKIRKGGEREEKKRDEELLAWKQKEGREGT